MSNYANDIRLITSAITELSDRVRQLEAAEIPTGGPVGAHTILDGTIHTDSVAQAVSTGSLIYGDGTPEWNELIHPGNLYHLQTNATTVVWAQDITMADDAWIGLAMAKARLIFNDTPVPDQVEIENADFNFITTNTGIIHTDDPGAGSFLRSDGTRIIPSTFFINGTAGQTYTLSSTGGTVPTGSGANLQVAYWSGVDTLTGSSSFQFNPTTGVWVMQSAVSNTPRLSVTNLNSDALGAILRFTKTTGTEADDDVIADIEYYGTTSTSATVRYAYLNTQTADVTNADYAGRITHYVAMDATERELFTISGYNGAVNQGEVIINEAGQDVDFRVEASGVVNAFVVQGSDGYVGIGTTSPDRTLEIQNSGTASIHLDGGNAQVEIDRVAITARAEVRYQTAAVNVWFVGLTDSDLVGDGTQYFIGTTSGGTSSALLIETSGNIGIGTDTPGNVHLNVQDSTLTSTATFYGGLFSHKKTGGAGGAADDYYGLWGYMELNQSTTIDNLYGVFGSGTLTLGTADIIVGTQGNTSITGGTVAVYTMGVQSFVDIDGGTINDVFGMRCYVDIEAAATITGDIYGLYVFVDDDDNTSTSHMVYLDERSNVDFCLYQAGTAINYLQGNLGIGTDSPAVTLHVTYEGASTTAVRDLLIVEQTYNGTGVAADFGAAIVYRLEDAAGTTREAANLTTVWQSAAAVENAEFQIFLNYNGTMRQRAILVGPSATPTAGNQRGAGATDLQSDRNAATQVASAANSVLCGGINNTASGTRGVVGGGSTNVASGTDSCVPGGSGNTASATSTLAAGQGATASDNYSYVWANGTATVSWGASTWTARCHGGARFYSAAGVGTGVQLSSGGTAWAAISDKRQKENVVLIGPEILEIVANIPVYGYNLITQDMSIRHISPFAQDFNTQLRFTEDPIRINMLDISGVTMAAVRELIFENRRLKERVEQLEQHLNSGEQNETRRNTTGD